MYLLECCRVEEYVTGLGDISSVEVVVVGHVLEVVVLQGHQEAQQSPRGHRERPQQVSLLEDPASSRNGLRCALL